MIKFRSVVPALLLCVFALLPSCQRAAAPPGAPKPTESAPPSTPVSTPAQKSAPAPDPVRAQMAELTTGQKVAQLLVAGIEGTVPGDDAVAAVQEYQVGGVILFGRNVEGAAQLAQLNHELRVMNGDYIPLFLCVDEEGGRVSRMPKEVRDLPAALLYGDLGGPDLCRRLGAALAAECAAFGFNMDFAPVLDVWSNAANTVIGDRAFGREPETVAAMAPQAAHGLMEAGVIPVVKHFPGHGDTSADSHLGLPAVSKTAEELMESELLPFRTAMAGETPVPAVMVAHILMSAIDPDRPASLSPAVVTGLLREELGFTGVVCTDDLTMAAVTDTHSMGEAAVLAVEAGCDLLLVCHRAENLTAAYDALLAAVESGRISMDRLDESLYRLLSLKRAYGLTNAPVPVPDVEELNARLAAVIP